MCSKPFEVLENFHFFGFIKGEGKNAEPPIGPDMICSFQQWLYMLRFNFIIGLNFLFFCFELIIIHHHTPKQKKIKFKPIYYIYWL